MGITKVSSNNIITLSSTAEHLKQLLQVDEVVAFGDNHNDIAMMKTADFCFAPENAVIEVKRIANRIIESCDDDGVAKYIKQKYEL